MRFPKIQKKRGDSCQLLAPLIEAVGLPITVRTSNYNPTPICIVSPYNDKRYT